MTVQYTKIGKVAIIGMEINVDLVAQFNPKEVQIDKSANWSPVDEAKMKQNGSDLRYEGTKPTPRTLSMELLFDGYEDNVDVSITYVAKLMQLINVMDPDGNDDDRKRPSIVQVVWPHPDKSKFQGVLQSVSTKYTMFNPDGKPVRATCSIKIMEVVHLRDVLSKIPGRETRGW